MIIKIKELCLVDYIDQNNKEEINKEEKELTAIRTVIYESSKDTLLEAFQEYDADEFDGDNIISSNDEFDGECLDTIKYISVEEVDENNINIYNVD